MAQIVRMPLVLLVEDNADTREMYASFFGSEGFRVLEAGDGLQALCQLAGERPDVMLLDLGLPRLNGVQLLRVIRQQPRLADLPVVVVSGQLELLNAADDIAADVVCPKPCEPEDLMRVVRSVLDRAGVH
ncbi:MAG TPA: response regulator [Myxococcales bacterium]|nr:response regulator [Myxococcales bacterium]